MKQVMVINADHVKFEASHIPEQKLLGEPVLQRLANLYSDAGQRFHVGFWESEMGSWKVDYQEHEYCQLLEGQVELEDEHGQVTHLTGGDQFVIPAGFKGIWRTLAPCRKVYVIFEPGPGG
ncbi:cupin domain-containing protein [Aliiglaciecola sp. CAU 1673]|uniref:cupin domain-containing protein n=1 Tax=Aliiglaciecola sp. CAU 1673 TaxID=3032595 RepID=UPI0023DA0F57|nr:cupin domain-containing protein [Aliiglaciecola sp. CAU 1673]MDF2177051.1 cupin domain-containing protein [Aliiglaciecola sp. CAU 1673]